MFTGLGYSGMPNEEIVKHLMDDWEAEEQALVPYQILAISGELGGYEEWAWILLKNKETGQLFEVAGSHCSCDGFEGQFEPKATTGKYLMSKNFGASGVEREKFQEWFLDYSAKMGELPLADARCT